MTDITRRTLTAMMAVAFLGLAVPMARAADVTIVAGERGSWARADARGARYAGAPVIVYREPLRLRFVEFYNGIGPPVRTVPWGPDYEIYRDKISGGME